MSMVYEFVWEVARIVVLVGLLLGFFGSVYVVAKLVGDAITRRLHPELAAVSHHKRSSRALQRAVGGHPAGYRREP